MKFDYGMVFLGTSTAESKKNPGKFYTNAKFIDTEDNTVFDFYIKDELLPQVQALKPFSPAQVIFNVTTFQGQKQVNFEGIK
jgi:hypothetical protein